MVVWVVVAVVVVVGVVVALFGWDRYRVGQKAAGGGSHAQPTGEVFVDPDTRHRTRVWFDPDTGRREYRPDLPPDTAPGADPLAVPNQIRRPPVEGHPFHGADQPAAPGLGRAAPQGAGGAGAADMRGAIKVTALTKRFGETMAVERLSFSVGAGSIVGFLGPNGAGKTTTMRALLGLVRPTAGTATIDGRRYSELEHPSQTVGALLDGDDLHPGRSGRNHLRVLARAAGVAPARVDELLELVGLKDVADRRAGGYSMGMRQRLGLAAALLGDPQVLVLDGPRTGWIPRASAGCATSCARRPARAARSSSPATCWPRSHRSPMRS